MIGLARSSWHYHHQPRPRVASRVPHTDRRSAAWLTAKEEAAIQAWLTDPHWVGESVSTVWALAFDQGTYLASRRTWYRIAARRGRTRPQRRRRTTPRPIPRVQASRAHQAWCWDITLLPTPVRGEHDAAVVILDLYSRWVVAATVLPTETSQATVPVLQAAIDQYGAPAVIHADGGAVMTSTLIQTLIAEAPSQASHSRPHTPNDNPYIESWFRTAKGRPTWPGIFASLPAAQAWLDETVTWANTVHRHASLGWMSPAAVLSGDHRRITANRQALLDTAYLAHPSRYGQPPHAPDLAATTWINPPTQGEIS